MKYEIITGTRNEVEGEVRGALNYGWTLVGQPFVTGLWIVDEDAKERVPEFAQAITIGG